MLLAANGDVLVLLDCCHAALYEGIEKSRGKFEVLAATTKGQLAILPGKLSFTTQLVDAIRKRLPGEEDIIVRDLHKSLMKLAVSPGDCLSYQCYYMHRTDFCSDSPNPHYTDLIKGGAESINLRNFRRPRPAGFSNRSAGAMVLQISLAGDVTGHELARWLQTYCPASVSSVDIENCIVKARNLQKIQQVLQEKDSDPSLNDKMSLQAKTEVLEKGRRLSAALSQSIDTANNQNTNKDADTAQKSYEEIEQGVTAVTDALETSLLLQNEPELDFATEDILRKIRSGNAAVLRQDLLEEKFTIGGSIRHTRGEIDLPDTEHRFRCGRLARTPVLVEAFMYQPDPRTAEPFMQTALQVAKMSALLSRPKEPFYRILHCRGFVEETLKNQIGLIFDVPDQYSIQQGPVLLSELYTHPNFRRVALEDRLHVALEIGRAIEHLHRLRWFHKELRSNNIFFLRDRDDPDRIVIHSPWLCGFEYARNFDEGTLLDEDYELQHNLYRHPERWGKPLKAFTRAHDMYGLGVILLEIFFWQSAKSMLEATNKRNNTTTAKPPRVFSQGVKQCYLEKISRDLAHLVGRKIADAVENCLDFEERTSGMDEYGSHLFFQKEILAKIESGAKLF